MILSKYEFVLGPFYVVRFYEFGLFTIDGLYYFYKPNPLNYTQEKQRREQKINFFANYNL